MSKSEKKLSDEMIDMAVELRKYPVASDWSHHPRAQLLEELVPRVQALEARLDTANLDEIVLRTGWILYGGEGVGWYIDENESTIELPEYRSSGSQSLTFYVVEKKK